MHLSHLKKKWHDHQQNDLVRHRDLIQHREADHVKIHGKKLTSFCSNDYLNLATHPAIKKALIRGVQQEGIGSTASPLVTGFSKSHDSLEEAFATFLNRERALLFNSGYHANLGVLSCFADRNSTVIADKLCHASLLDGILLSRAKHLRYLHQDVDHAETLLKKQKKEKLLVTESIFSMQGSLTPAKKLAAIANKHRAFFILDDAHGVGILGKEGRGICEHDKLTQQDVPCLVTPLGKAFGSMGAMVSGESYLIQTLLQFARTYCYSTALPPALCDATKAALKIIEKESWRREKLKYLIQFFIKAAQLRNIPLVSADKTPIKSILIGSNKRTVQIKNDLMRKGFFVSCIRPPSVPKNTSRIRISLNCMHHEKQISDLLDLIKIHLEYSEKHD